MTTRNIMLYQNMLRHMGNDLVCIKGIWYFFMAKQFSFGRANVTTYYNTYKIVIRQKIRIWLWLFLW